MLYNIEGEETTMIRGNLTLFRTILIISRRTAGERMLPPSGLPVIVLAD